MHFITCTLLLLIAISLEAPCLGVSLEEELTLTYPQKKALDELKNEISGKLAHEYMYEEIYLIKYLRYQNFNVKAAKSSMLNMVKWRKELNMDDIGHEDFSYYVKKYPFWLDGRDKTGRPVGTADISVWDPRPVILGGKGDQLLRYALSAVERGVKMIREDQKLGKNVTQLTIVANMDGFNLIQHACVPCIPFYIRFLLAFDQAYPGFMHKLFFINTPSSFDVLLRIARPVLNKQITESWSIHGTNKKEWRDAVLAEISEDQIRKQFGGTKLQDLDDY